MHHLGHGTGGLQNLSFILQKQKFSSMVHARDLFGLPLLMSPNITRQLLALLWVIFPLLSQIFLPLFLNLFLLNHYLNASYNFHISPLLISPSISPLPTFSDTLPTIPNTPLVAPSSETSNDSFLSHPYLLHSLVKSSSYACCGFGIIPPSIPSNLPGEDILLCPMLSTKLVWM